MLAREKRNISDLRAVSAGQRPARRHMGTVNRHVSRAGAVGHPVVKRRGHVPITAPVSSRILIAENDPSTCAMLAGLLQGEGFICCSAWTDKEAASIGAHVRPDVALVRVDALNSHAMQFARTLASDTDPVAVIVITAPNPAVALEAAGAGAADCLPWPTSPAGVVTAVRRAVALREQVGRARRESRVPTEVEQGRDALMQLVDGLSPDAAQTALLGVLRQRSPDTYDHVRRVARYAVALARRVRVPAIELPDIRRAALLHDVGKIAVPHRILSSSGHLDASDIDALRAHASIGADVLGSVRGLGAVATMVGATHERVDGGGYPAGLQAADIPLAARIIAVADTYDALTSDRSYRRALTHADATTELMRVAGSQLDAHLVDAWIRLTERGPCF